MYGDRFTPQEEMLWPCRGTGRSHAALSSVGAHCGGWARFPHSCKIWVQFSTWCFASMGTPLKNSFSPEIEKQLLYNQILGDVTFLHIPFGVFPPPPHTHFFLIKAIPVWNRTFEKYR